MNDNPILRPVENGFADVGWTRDGFDVSGRESNPHLLVSRDALTQLNYQFDNQSTAAHPKKERRTRCEMGIHQLPDGARFERARGFPLDR